MEAISAQHCSWANQPRLSVGLTNPYTKLCWCVYTYCFQIEICPPTLIWKVSVLYDAHIINLTLSILSISISINQSSQTSSIINGEIGTWALSTWHGRPYREERNQLELQISLYRLWKKPGGLAQTSCRCLYVVRKTHSSTPKVTTAVWARIMLAACLYSAFKPMDGSTLKKNAARHCCYSYS